MIHHQPIQTDFEGLYHSTPEKLPRKHFGNTGQAIQLGEERRKELLIKAKLGDKEAIDTLKRVYNIKVWIVAGKKVI